MTVKQCADCRNGEHENYDDDVRLVYLRDRETNKIVKRAFMCNEHRVMYDQDGYEVKEIK